MLQFSRDVISGTKLQSQEKGHGNQLRPSTLVWTCEFIVDPKLAYAVVVWRHRIIQKTVKAVLEIMRGLGQLERLGQHQLLL